jgi:hypothetical protein
VNAADISRRSAWSCTATVSTRSVRA